jgi:hypothetical protein
VNEIIERFKGSSRRREKNYIDSSLVSMDWNLHVKDYSSNKSSEKEVMQERDPCMKI